MTTATLVKQITRAFPKAVLAQFPDYQQFLYMAIAVSFLGVIPLVFSPKVISLSSAQLGFAAGLVYIVYALLGIFLPAFHIVWLIMYAMTILILVWLFSSGVVFAFKQRSIPDVIIDLSMGTILLVISILPLWIKWRQP